MIGKYFQSMFYCFFVFISIVLIDSESNFKPDLNTEILSKPTGADGYLQTWLTSIYRCDKGSYFRRVNRTAQGLSDFKCNQITLDTHNYTVLAYQSDTDEEMELIVNTAYYALRDINGNEDYSNFGTISGGKCKGGLVLIKDMSFVTQGSCSSNTGVTQVQSGPRDALMVIEGVCKSICSGKVVADYWPGKVDDNLEYFEIGTS